MNGFRAPIYKSSLESRPSVDKSDLTAHRACESEGGQAPLSRIGRSLSYARGQDGPLDYPFARACEGKGG